MWTRVLYDPLSEELITLIRVLYNILNMEINTLDKFYMLLWN